MAMKTRLAGMAPDGLYMAHTVDGKETSPGEAVFPIVSQEPDGTFVALGSGFFIAEQGVFMTAAHVMREVIGDDLKATAPVGLFQFAPARGEYVIRPIFIATCHTVADVAVGIARQMTHAQTGEQLGNRLVTLARDPPAIGSMACTFAYPKTKVTRGKPQTVKFTPGFFEGRVQCHHPDGRDSVMLPGACYETSMVLHGAASGGPVFNEQGRVFGVNSTGYEDTPLSFVTCISSALDLALPITMPGEASPRSVQIRELIEKGLVLME